MKRQTAATVGFGFWLALSGCGVRDLPPAAAARTAGSVEVDRQAVLAAEADWDDAVAKHDVERVLAFFADDGASLPPDHEMVVGDGPRREYLAALFAEPDFESSWETTRVDVSAAGDMALSVGTTSHAGRGPDGVPFTEQGKYVTVWGKVDGEWKVLADMWNSTAVTPSPVP